MNENKTNKLTHLGMIASGFHLTVANRDEDLTEDEEVKLNAFAKSSGYRSSDLDSFSEESRSSSREETGSKGGVGCEAREKSGIINFASNLTLENPVLHPKAISGNFDLGSDEESSSEDEEEEDNQDPEDNEYHDIPLSIGTPPGSSDDTSSVSESESESDEIEESDYDDDCSKPRIGVQAAESFEESADVIDDEITRILEESLSPSPSTDKSDEDSLEEEDMAREETAIFPKSKRILSFQYLLSLDSPPETPKKRRMSVDGENLSGGSMPHLDLGQAAIDGLPRSLSQIRLDSPRLQSRTDTHSPTEEELEDELRSELEQNVCDETKGSKESSPVPLLTPPGSPLTVEVEGSNLVEWPSNLAVDSAQLASYELRPMSPDSLQAFEEEEEARVMNGLTGGADDQTKEGGASSQDLETTTLTPLLRGIYVD